MVGMSGAVLGGCASSGAVPNGSWSGPCVGDPTNWDKVGVSLTLTGDEEKLDASGELRFVGRRAKATLSGAKGETGWQLTGEMVEVGGIGTKWSLRATVRALGEDRVLRGSFTEVLDVGGAEAMCKFALPSGP